MVSTEFLNINYFHLSFILDLGQINSIQVEFNLSLVKYNQYISKGQIYSIIDGM